MTIDELLTAYRVYHVRFQADDAWSADLLSFEQHRIPSESGSGGQWLIYHMQVTDFVREVLNAVNLLRVDVARLSAWAHVLSDRSDQERVDLLLEFVRPVAVGSLDAPYKIKNRINFAACYLCDAANATSGRATATALPSDGRIRRETLGQVGESWTRTQPLVEALGLVDAPEFRELTGNFRNVEHHRIPRGIEVGLTRPLTRMAADPGTRQFAIGSSMPLPLSVIVPGLQTEHARIVCAVGAFWDLIQEHLPQFSIGTHQSWSHRA